MADASLETPAAQKLWLGDHNEKNLQASGLTDETIRLARLYTETDHHALGRILNRSWPRGSYGNGLVFPFFVPGNDHPIGYRVRPTNEAIVDGKKAKYLSAVNGGVLVYFPPYARACRWFGDVGRTLYWTEGEKKALLLDQLRLACIGLTGVQCAHDKQHKDATGERILHPLIREHVTIAGREHVICFDADARDPEKPQILKAARQLARMLLAAGAAGVRFICPPLGGPKGIDDYYVANGERGEQATRELLDSAVPLDLTEPPKAKRKNERERPPSGSKALTDLGNAERFVALHGERVRYCPQRKLWLSWDGKRWAWDHTGEALRLAKNTVRSIYLEAAAAEDSDARKALADHAHKSESAARIAALVQLAQSEPGIPVMPEQLDADPWVFNAANGLVNLRTGELGPHDPAALCTKVAGAEYRPGARSELFDQVLAHASAGSAETARYLQRSLGCAIIGAVVEKKVWFFYGPPDGGKSTWITAIDGALGDYAATADFSTWLVQHATGGNRGDLVSLMGARLVTSVEVKRGARFDEALVKKVTGGDAIKAAAKFENEVTFTPAFALWLAGNDAPGLRDDDDGMWSRMQRVPFTSAIKRKDAAMREKLAAPDVRAAILAWAVEGCLAWQREGLGRCPTVEQSTADYRAEVDRIAGFFDEECVFDSAYSVPTAALRKAYARWCEDHDIKPLADQYIVKRLRERGAESAKVGGVRKYRGVRLAVEYERERRAAEKRGEQNEAGGVRGSHGARKSLRDPHTRESLRDSLEAACPIRPCDPPPESGGRDFIDAQESTV